jgi:hypothetical protein
MTSSSREDYKHVLNWDSLQITGIAPPEPAWSIGSSHELYLRREMKLSRTGEDDLFTRPGIHASSQS